MLKRYEDLTLTLLRGSVHRAIALTGSIPRELFFVTQHTPTGYSMYAPRSGVV